MVFLLQRSGKKAARLLGGMAVLSILEVAGCAFVGFLYIAILATAVTRKTRGRTSPPAHPDTTPVPNLDRAA